MEFKIIGVERKEYHSEEYPNKYYIHVSEYPYVIQVPFHIYSECLKNNIVSLNLPYLKVINYNGKYYYKYENKEGKE